MLNAFVCCTLVSSRTEIKHFKSEIKIIFLFLSGVPEVPLHETILITGLLFRLAPMKNIFSETDNHVWFLTVNLVSFSTCKVIWFVIHINRQGYTGTIKFLI